MSNTFPWHDEYYLKSEHPDTLAVAARVLDLVEDLSATAQEINGDNEWVLYGLATTARALMASGNSHALGLLLTGLESIVPAERRQNWARHNDPEVIDGATTLRPVYAQH